jgi:DNA-binding transcriptional regulator YdaS (Cro superfamily)
MSHGLKKALEIAGGTRALAKALGITAGAISHWDRIPAERLLEIEKVTGVPRDELRPDLYQNYVRKKRA